MPPSPVSLTLPRPSCFSETFLLRCCRGDDLDEDCSSEEEEEAFEMTSGPMMLKTPDYSILPPTVFFDYVAHLGMRREVRR